MTTPVSFDNVLAYDTAEVITILPQRFNGGNKTKRNLITMKSYVLVMFLASFVFLWFIWAHSLFTSHLSGNNAPHYKHIVGVWSDGEMMIVYEDRNELKFQTTPLNAESDCDEWKVMPQPTSMHLPHSIIHALQKTNINSIFTMHASYASTYDLKTQKVTKQYSYPLHLYSHMNDNIVCVTENALQNGQKIYRIIRSFTELHLIVRKILISLYIWWRIGP
eukprot:32142_1